MQKQIRLVGVYGALIIIALTGVLSSESQAASKGPTSAMMAPVNIGFKALNTGNAALWNSVHTADAVIIDEFAPYRWQAPGASAKWWADFGNWAKTNKITKPHVSAGTVRFWDMKAGRAYIVVPTTFTAVQNGKSLTETGTLTFVMVKTGSRWKAQGWTWGTTSAH